MTEEVVQPDNQEVEGQGTSEDNSLDPGLFPGIEEVPADYRQHLDPILREINTNANKKISEVNERLKAWEPYEQLGVNEIDPETMEGLIGLLSMMGKVEDDPTEFKEWWETVGKEYGFFPEEELGEEEPGEFDFEEDEDYMSPEDLQSMVREAIKAEMTPFLEEQQQRQQEQQLNEADSKIEEQLQALKDAHGDFDETTEQRICQLAMAYPGDENAIEKGFNDLKQIVENAEGNLFTKAEEQPPRPEGPGVPNTTPEKITDMDKAAELAKERILQSS